MNQTARLVRCGCAALALLCLVPSAEAAAGASAAENRAFTAATRSFEGKFWEFTEQEFAAFVQQYPNSERRAEALLRQAQARFKQKNSTGAAELLSASLAEAGTLADEYQFWLAEARFQGSNYLAAAEEYGRVVQQFPNSPHVAEAAYNQALACARLRDWPRVTALLGPADSVLQRQLRSGATNQLALDAALLLAEARLELKDYPAVEQALAPVATLTLPVRSDWLRQYLLCRAQLGQGQSAPALDGITCLAAIAASSGQRDLLAETAAFKANILRRSGQSDAAVAEYEKNLAEDVAPQRRRQALLSIIELRIEQGRLDEAAQRLEKFLAQYPQDASSSTVLLALGEVNLRRCLGRATTNQLDTTVTAVSATNCLQLALAQLDAVVTNGPQSSLFGRAQLDRGSCLWRMDRLVDSQQAFEAAARTLPPSADQIFARFKWADAQFRRDDFVGALTNYGIVVSNLVGSTAQLSEQLLEPALYQLLRAADKAGDQSAAEAAMSKIRTWYPDSYICQAALVIQGQSLDRVGRPAAAREVFAEFEKRFPSSSLLPLARLAIARTWEGERNWPAALEVYDAWVTNFTANTNLAQAQYLRGWANYQAGRETNALSILTNLVVNFPTSEFAPLAQNWIADFYFRNGDYQRAEDNYQLLFQKWPATELAYPARLMAARAAVGRLGYAEAISYLTNLISDMACPSNLVAQALFAYGDATLLQPQDTNRLRGNFEEARAIFNKLQQLYPAHPLSLLAWGRIGDCYYQLAERDRTNYDAAAQAYLKLMADARAGVSARSQAEVGLAFVLEKQAQRKSGAEATELRKLALQHFVKVAHEKSLREGEEADPFWLKKAGLEAVRLAEDLQLWEQAATLYEGLIKLLPPLRPSLEPKLSKARERMSRAAE